MLRLGLTLFIVTAVMAAALSGVYVLTKDTIAEQEAAAVSEAVGAVLPEDVESVTGYPAEEPEYYVGYDAAGNPAGYAAVCDENGYSSTLQIMVGVDESGVITGTSVLSQQETPGLGERIGEVKAEGSLWSAVGGLFSDDDSAEGQGPPPRPWFQEQYIGCEADEVNLGSPADPATSTVQAITGATITSRAFTTAVREDMGELLERLDAGELEQ